MNNSGTLDGKFVDNILQEAYEPINLDRNAEISTAIPTQSKKNARKISYSPNFQKKLDQTPPLISNSISIGSKELDILKREGSNSLNSYLPKQDASEMKAFVAQKCNDEVQLVFQMDVELIEINTNTKEKGSKNDESALQFGVNSLREPIDFDSDTDTDSDNYTSDLDF